VDFPSQVDFPLKEDLRTGVFSSKERTFQILRDLAFGISVICQEKLEWGKMEWARLEGA
jgi:hypothetical protein